MWSTIVWTLQFTAELPINSRPSQMLDMQYRHQPMWANFQNTWLSRTLSQEVKHGRDRELFTLSSFKTDLPSQTSLAFKRSSLVKTCSDVYLFLLELNTNQLIKVRRFKMNLIPAHHLHCHIRHSLHHYRLHRNQILRFPHQRLVGHHHRNLHRFASQRHSFASLLYQQSHFSPFLPFWGLYPPALNL